MGLFTFKYSGTLSQFEAFRELLWNSCKSSGFGLSCEGDEFSQDYYCFVVDDPKIVFVVGYLLAMHYAERGDTIKEMSQFVACG